MNETMLYSTILMISFYILVKLACVLIDETKVFIIRLMAFLSICAVLFNIVCTLLSVIQWMLMWANEVNHV